MQFKSKRQRREDALRKWTPSWSEDEDFLFSVYEPFFEATDGGAFLPVSKDKREQIWSDPAERSRMIGFWLDDADAKEGFAFSLDRLLSIRTDEEDRQYESFTTIRRNKAYILFTLLALVISALSLTVSYWNHRQLMSHRESSLHSHQAGEDGSNPD